MPLPSPKLAFFMLFAPLGHLGAGTAESGGTGLESQKLKSLCCMLQAQSLPVLHEQFHETVLKIK